MSDPVALNQSKFMPLIDQMIANSTEAPLVTEDNVFQLGRPANKPYVKEIMADLLLPGSRIVGRENLLALHELARRKKPCLILMEHYSNFDIPCFYELLDRAGPQYREAADAIVSVAGVKLNEESKLVLAFTEVFTRVVLYPSRGMKTIRDAHERHAAERRRAKLNIAAMKMLRSLRKEGRLILVFPSGTRYRPWDPSTARGLKEMDTYLKFYSYMVLVSINGNTLVPNEGGGMDEDYPVQDLMLYTISPVRRCSEFRRQALKGRDHGEDPKQIVADGLMTS
ncbi:MAG TPA: 1-acyl-sn-glycerol-3-phosphate acyltransferase, partial [Spirochaetia bacterium]|nr:1-acyl-sn-glycerol-3-phosphate acyltransferase [Spirochaetia bacterium]